MSTERTLPKSTITERRRDGSVGMKYQPLELIGSGGSAIAFSAAVLDADDKPTDEIYLLKEFYPENGALRDENDTVRVLRTNDKDALRTQFLREVSAGKEASQYIYGATTATNSFESDNGNTYIVMPYEKHGLSLKNFCEWLKENGKTVPIRAWARLFQKLSDRVRNLHENARILHSDISVGNVMIMQSDDPAVLYEYVCSENADYTVILLDFGCAYFQDDVYIYEGSDILTAEKRDVVFTTNEFASPELKESTRQEITTFTDIYSIVACFKKCINAVESGDKYIFSADIPATAKTQVNKILGILNADESEYVYKASVLIDMLDELIRRIDGKGVSKAAIWEAARKDFEAKCKGRFANLDIVEAILPIGKKAQGTLPVVASDGEKQSGVLDLIELHKGRNICIYGDGGVGKTTTLVKKMHDEYDGIVYDESNVVPIYIELNRCPANIVEAEGAGASQSHFIVRHIRKLLDGSDYSFNSNSEDDDDVLTAVQKEFRGKEDQGDSYDYLLLLDGLNEASSVTINGTSARLALIGEIRKVADDYGNVRIILTSRSEHGELNRKGEYMFDNIELEGITEETVIQYLTDNATGEHVKAAKNSESLMEILKTPLFLTVFARVKPDEMYTRGGLLRAFWQEKAESYYTQSSVHERSSEDHLRKALNPEAYSFMLDFILPALCYEMEKNEEFRLPKDKVMEIINGVLNDNDDYGLLGNHGRSAFNEYTKTVTGSIVDISTVVDNLKETLGQKAWIQIAAELAESIAVLYPEDNCAGYCIRHHHLRDYFASVYWVNRFKLAWQVFADGESDKAYELLMLLAEKPLRVEILTFIGEYLGENKNKPVMDETTGEWSYIVPDTSAPCDRNLIKRVLDIFRDRFDKSNEYALYNLIDIIKRVRVDLSGSDFSRLDLTTCHLNGTRLGRKGCGSDFTGARIDDRTLFLNNSQYSTAYHVAINSTITKIIACYDYCPAKVWDVATGQLLFELLDVVKTAEFSPDDRKILTVSGFTACCAKEWDASTGKCIRIYNNVLSARYSTDGKTIIFASFNKLMICNAEDGQIVSEILYQDNYDDKRKCLRSIFPFPFSVGMVTENGEGGTHVIKYPLGKRNYFDYAAFSPNGEKIVTVSRVSGVTRSAYLSKCEYNIEIWNAITLKKITSISGLIEYSHNCQNFRLVEFSRDSKKIISKAFRTIWDAETGNVIPSFKDKDCVYPVTSLNPVNDLYVTANNNTVEMFSINSSKHIKTLSGHDGDIVYTVFSKNGKYLITSSRDGTIRIWNVNTGCVERIIQGRGNYIRQAVYSPEGNLFAVASDDLDVKIFDANTNKLIMVLNGHKALITSLNFNMNGTLLVTTSLDTTAKVWNVNTGKVVFTFYKHDNGVSYASFNHAGTKLITASFDTTARVWNLTDGHEVLCLKADYEKGLSTAFFSKDDTKIITSDYDGIISIYSEQNGDRLLSCERKVGLIAYANFINDDNSLIFFYRDVIRILNINNGQFIKKLCCRETILGHKRDFHWISWIDYNEENSEITVTHDNGRIDIRDANSGQVKAILAKKKRNGYAGYFCYSPDRKRLLVSSNTEALLLDARTGKQLDSIKSIPGLIVIDCEMRSLHPKSNISRENIENLRRYGAII